MIEGERNTTVINTSKQYVSTVRSLLLAAPFFVVFMHVPIVSCRGIPTQVFWLVLELAAGNESSHGYVRLSSVACYAFALHVGGHLLLFHYRRRLGHHALEFLLDLVTDVVGFAWINVAEEMLAQVTAGRAVPVRHFASSLLCCTSQS